MWEVLLPLLRPLSRPTFGILVLLIAACAAATAAAPAAAEPICGEGMYAYAGYDGHSPTRGVSATLTQAGPLTVLRGHVAAWIGIVDPERAGAWLQVGMSAMPGQAESAVYYEYAMPGSSRVYREVVTGIAVGEPHRVAVLEERRQPGWWEVRVDGRRAAPPVHLPGSHDRWKVQALGESWAGDASGPCNAYSYSFDDLSLRPAPGSRAGKPVTLLRDPHYVVAQRSQSGFVVASFGVGSVRSAQSDLRQTPPHVSPTP
jgi:hypothetical protein